MSTPLSVPHKVMYCICGLVTPAHMRNAGKLLSPLAFIYSWLHCGNYRKRNQRCKKIFNAWICWASLVFLYWYLMSQQDENENIQLYTKSDCSHRSVANKFPSLCLLFLKPVWRICVVRQVCLQVWTCIMFVFIG